MNIDLFASGMNRRRWLQLGAGAVAGSLAGVSSAKEGHGAWDEVSIAEYTQKLMDWLKADFARRAGTLADAGGSDFKLQYDYLAPTEDKSRLRTFEKYAQGKLAQNAAEKHVETCLAEYERVRQTLAAAEAKALGTWKPADSPEAVREGKIYDSTVTAGRLTVILDNSRSMAPHLEAVRKEISRDFASAYFVEVDGCSLVRQAENPWFFSAPSTRTNPFSPDRHIPKVPQLADQPHSAFIRWTRDAPSALSCMVDLMKSDAIYWFCDFDDDCDDEIIKSLARRILDQKTKLFLHTLDKKPPALLATLAEKSGGQVLRKRV